MVSFLCFVCLSVCLFVCLFACLFVCLSFMWPLVKIKNCLKNSEPFSKEFQNYVRRDFVYLKYHIYRAKGCFGNTKI